jgi:hypothetical protein
MMIVQAEMDLLFAAEVRRMQRDLCDFHDPQGSVARSYAHELQAMWRRLQGTSQSDGDVASGEMLNAVRAALGRAPK